MTVPQLPVTAPLPTPPPGDDYEKRLNKALADIYSMLARRIETMVSCGPASDRPNAIGSRRVWASTDSGTISVDVGGSWVEAEPLRPVPLPVSLGGTGATSLTDSRILIGRGTNAIEATSGLVWDSINGRLGIGAAPSVEGQLQVVSPSGSRCLTSLVAPGDVHGELRFYDGASTLSGRLFGTFGNSAGYRYFGFSARQDKDGYKLPIRFWVWNAAGGEVEALYIGAGSLAGRVGFGGVTSPSSTVDVAGDVEIGSGNAFYLGDPSTDGGWRITRDSNNLVFQRRESGSWVTKYTVTP